MLSSERRDPAGGDKLCALGGPECFPVAVRRGLGVRWFLWEATLAGEAGISPVAILFLLCARNSSLVGITILSLESLALPSASSHSASNASRSHQLRRHNLHRGLHAGVEKMKVQMYDL